VPSTETAEPPYKIIWITWERHRRNETLSQALGAKLFQFEFYCNPICRYARSSLATLATLVRERPTVIGVQNPSLVLALLATSYGRMMRIPVVMDAHNAGLWPPSPRFRRLLHAIARSAIARAALTIVTNDNLTEYVRQHGGRPFVLSNSVPELDAHAGAPQLKGRRNVLFICSYASDEPYVDVIRAACTLSADTFVYVTGKPKQDWEQLKAIAPPNVVLTGFLPERDFVALLLAVDVVVDLTTREDCLLQGAYEAVAAEKPMVLSDTSALRTHFGKGACFTDNSAADLAHKMTEALNRIPTLTREVKELKHEHTIEGERQQRELNALLRRLSAGGSLTA
jgi:glycosyltransferase involved in cell wall biosynthesis